MSFISRRLALSSVHAAMVTLLIIAGSIAFSAEANFKRVRFAPAILQDVDAWGQAITLGDVNGDSRADVLEVTDSYGSGANAKSLLIFEQTTTGSLSAPIRFPAFYDCSSVALGDLNGDHMQDVAIGNHNPGEGFGILYGSGGGILQPMELATDVGRMVVAIDDIDHDTRADLIVQNDNGISRYLQLPSGHLNASADNITSNVGDFRVADMNGDQLEDLVVVPYYYNRRQFEVYLQKADHTFGMGVTSSEDGDGPDAIDVGDLNGDGRPDIVMAYNDTNPRVALYLQEADGTFTTTSLKLGAFGYPGAAKIADLNGDGRKDLVIGDTWDFVRVLLQQSDGTLAEEQDFPVQMNHFMPGTMDVADLNSDGLADIAITGWPGLYVLYQRYMPDPTDLQVVATPASTTATISAADAYTFTITNIGQTSATDIVLTGKSGRDIYFTTGTVSQGEITWYETGFLGDLEPGASAQAMFWLHPTKLGQIDYFTTVSCSNGDVNVSNNTAGVHLSVINGPGPDLTAEWTTSPVLHPACASCKFRGYLRVQNRGDSPSPQAKIDFHVSSSPEYTYPLVPFASKTIAPLKPGKSRVIKIRKKLGWTLGFQPYAFAIVDANGKVSEGNEYNNFTSILTVRPN